jgi:hypothetical protein
MHQPFGLMVPSTVWHAFGAVKSLQLLHICSPFGESWYLTTFCEILAARAGRVAASIVAAPLVHIAAPNKERLESRGGVILRTFVIVISSRENCRDATDQTPALENRN